VPLLKAEVDCFPEHLFDIGVGEQPWIVAYVRSRQEKKLARHLISRDVPCYLPIQQRDAHRSGRRFTSYLPLFPGYVFFRGRAPERRLASTSNLIVNTIEVLDQSDLDRELEELCLLQKAGIPLIPHPYLGPGDDVEICEGSFKGYRGKVIREHGNMRLVVSISLLRRSVAAEFEREVLAPVRSVRPLRPQLRQSKIRVEKIRARSA
jgi:transcription antitermination factor NusG